MTILISNLKEHRVNWETYKTDDDKYSYLMKKPFQLINDNRHKNEK